jgi:hypothetical protein
MMTKREIDEFAARVLFGLIVGALAVGMILEGLAKL